MVALGVACLTNTDIDLTFLGDRRVGVHPLLGLPPSSPGCDAPKCAGDISAARYLLRRACLSPQNKANVLGDPNLTANAMQDTWINYAVSMQPLSEEQRWTGLAFTLEHALQHRTFLVGHKVSLADLALFAAFGWPCALAERTKVLQYLQSKNCPSAMRWIKTLAANPCLQKATQLAVGVNGSDEAVFEADGGLDELPDGMSLLEGATPGQVVTRFPPEPSGYLHVGHAKACLLNDFYACRYKGRLVFRFDDTNPDKEKGEYEQSIIEDLALLGVKFDVLSYTSDYIGTIQGKVLELIERGLAYMDDTPQEQMKEERAARQDSKHRNMSPAEAKEKFELMCSGSPEGAAWCLRAKIDMKSNNGTLRDPVLYRQNLTPHHRTGTTYKAYPTYDLACPIVDSIEGVTHALRTTEYNDRDEQYQWLQKALGLRRVRIHSFARMNFQYTVLSKRKLTWFVNEGLVTGWDDARFPTVRGVIRRGVNVSALKKYIYSQGASRNVVNMVWHKFWATNAKELDKTAKRFMAIDASNNIKLKVTNAPAASANAFVTAPLHPKDSTIGTRAIRIAQDVLLETGDVDGLEVGERIVLMRWGVIEITKVDLSSGQVEGIEIPDGDFKACKRKLTWITDVPNNPIVVLTEFDHLVTKEKLEDGDKFEDYVNPCTIATTKVIADPGLKSLQKHETIQLERRGYYRVDKEFSSNTDNGTMVLYMIPDGKSKSMGGIVGQLAHH
jgi:glutamyl-tRNA synthetase